MRPQVGTLLSVLALAGVLLLGCTSERSASPPAARMRPTPAATSAQTPDATAFPAASTPTAPSVPLTVIPVPRTASPSEPGRVVLYARDDDLWRTDVSGLHREPLTVGRALNWRNEWVTDWLQAARQRPPRVSPDGRWIAFPGGEEVVSTYGQLTAVFAAGDMLVVDVTGHTQASFRQPGAGVVDWAPNSRSFAYVVSSPEGDRLCVYDPARGRATSLLSRQGIKHFAWSPDSRYIAFTCCFEVVEPYTVTGRSTGLVQRLDVSTQQLERVGQAQIGVASSGSLCWSMDGRVITTTEGAVRCSPQDAWWTSGVSADGTRITRLTPLYSADGTANGAVLATARYADGRAGSVLWERQVREANVTRAYWSPDDRYLLLDDEDPHSPVWRLQADGTGQLEVVVDDGYLLGVVSQWRE